MFCLKKLRKRIDWNHAQKKVAIKKLLHKFLSFINEMGLSPISHRC